MDDLDDLLDADDMAALDAMEEMDDIPIGELDINLNIDTDMPVMHARFLCPLF